MFNLTLVTLLTAAASMALASCVDAPSDPACERYVYPNATEDLNMLCGMGMGSMGSCSVRKQCLVGGAVSAACDEFSLLMRACEAMPAMGACANEQKLCANGTVVQACADELPCLRRMPSAVAAYNAARLMCEQMPSMTECKTCGATPGACPDPLLSLGELCRSMPSMDACSAWKSWCLAPGSEHDLPAYCAGVRPGDVPPEMRMYFHWGWIDYILFESWVPRSATAYAVAIAATFAGAVCSLWLRGMRAIYEVQLYQQAVPVLRANAGRAAFTILASLLDYSLMLVAMTFNLALFIALMIGFGVGTLAFGHLGKLSVATSVPGVQAPFLNAPQHEGCCT